MAQESDGLMADERRYSDEELRRILAEATKAEDAPGRPADVVVPSGPHDGFTLREIQEIAREAGIDPGAVERAARNLPLPRPIRVPLEPAGPFARIIRGESVIDRVLGDREMRSVALEAERVLGRRGRVERRADSVEWRADEERLTVVVARDGSGTRIRVACDQSPDLVRGSIFLGACGLAGTVLALTVGGPVLLAGLPLIAGGTIGLIWLHALGRSARTRDRLRELLEQLDDVARLG